MTDPKTVRPADILQNAQTSIATSRLADSLQKQSDPGGTPYAKTRLGYVTAFDPSTWTVTALIGDLLTPIPSIPVLGNVLPAIEAPGLFTQTGGSSTTEYTLVGMLPKDPGTPTYGQTWRIRKPAFQNISNVGPSLQADTDLVFYGQAGRTYLYEAALVVNQNTTADMDIIVGWIVPSGATWFGGGLGPTLAIPLGGSESSGSGANWRAFTGASGGMKFGVEPATTTGTFGNAVLIQFHGSLKMGATSGLCQIAWCQATPLSASTRVQEGSYLKVDMTSEYTL